MNILVSFALEAEFSPWCRLRRFQRLDFGDAFLQETCISNARVEVILTGVGARRIGDLNALVARYQPHAVIVAGVAGGLNPELRPGDVVVAESVCNTGLNECWRTDSELFKAAVQCGARPVSRFITVARIVRTAGAKSALAHVGDAVEMETLPVIRELSRQGIPTVAVRAIADSAEKDVPWDLEASLDSLGKIRLGRLLRGLIRRPWRLASTIEFGLTSHRATVALARYLDCFIARIAALETTPDPLLPLAART